MWWNIRSVFHRSKAERAATLSEAMFPHRLVVPIIVGIVAMAIMVVVVVVVRRTLLVTVGILHSSLREPVVITSITRCGRHGVVGSSIPRVGWRQGCAPLVGTPSSVTRPVARSV